MSPILESSFNEPITYRQALVTALFAKIRAGDSCAVIGAASMGKSRLLQFMLRPEVRAYYLGSADATTLLIWVDCNRLVAFSAWGLHELLLTGLLEASVHYAVIREQRETLLQLRRETILQRNKLLAQRNVEMALQIFCQELKVQVCFIFDEFDEAYQQLPARALASLRALRDRHKYRLTYLLFLRQPLDQLRPVQDCEGFYELSSHALFGLQPYGQSDAQDMIAQVMQRRQSLPMPDDASIQQLLQASGGHPGFIGALVEGMSGAEASEQTWQSWAQTQPKVQEECRKLWAGLSGAEQETLHHLAQGIATDFRQRQSLLLKGLIVEDTPQTVRVFSPIFASYAASQSTQTQLGLRIDTQAGTVWVDGRAVEQLAPQEFALLCFLYDNLDDLCSSEQIINAIYPLEKRYGVNERNITTIVGRVRKKLEPDPAHPRYLLNVHGQGYKLVATA